MWSCFHGCVCGFKEELRESGYAQSHVSVPIVMDGDM